MHFITFPVASTNIFPLVNSKQGGQLITEFNMKSREMVMTDPKIKYAVGPSFIHSMDDFAITLLSDSDVADYDATIPYFKGDYRRYGNDTYICLVDITTPEPFNADHWSKTVISTSIIQIGAGRAVINGHYVEALEPMTIDLNLANAELRRNSQEPLYGNLSIGIKSYFSTENTMAGAMLVENTDNMYVGVQIIIAKTSDFKVPGDEGCCELSEQGNATADIKLADFTFVNGSVSPYSILPNKDATRYIASERIYDFDNILDDKYVTSENLTDRMFYTFSGVKKGWCDSTDSIMSWDAHSEQNWKPYSQETMPDEWREKQYPLYWANTTEAVFTKDADDNVKFIIPHKQPDGEITNDSDTPLMYYPKVLSFPTASYSNDTSGIVTKEYTQRIKEISSVINTYKQFTNGKQIMYFDSIYKDESGRILTSGIPLSDRNADAETEFPTDLTNYNVGDYILVREDYTVATAGDEGIAPSTMYVVLPGGVTSVLPTDMTTTKPNGVRLGNVQSLWEGDEEPAPTTTKPDATELLDMFAYTSYRGTTDDYFEIVYHNIDDTVQTSYYYPVGAAGAKSWSNAILLTGGIPLATSEQIGGFYNASTDSMYEDAGYVYLDDTGHLRLRDYALLRTGALAYQLGADFTVPTNSTLEYIQAYLDDGVNARVAFKSQAVLTSTPTMINVNIPLPEEAGIINIYNIDSRFDTGVYLHFTTDDLQKDYSNVVINISDCEKIRIDNSITTWTNGPVINIFRSCLYYDAELINYIRICDPNNVKRTALLPSYNNFTGFDNLSLWYSRFSSSDPDLIVNGMEISQPNVAMATEEISFWDEAISGDNHYSYALRSITLSGSGEIIGCSLYVSNGSTPDTPTDVTATKHTIIGGDFVIPQGSALNYPVACINRPIIVTGSFTSAYMADNDVDWIVTDTNFTAMSGIYSVETGVENGSIAFNSSTYLVPATYTHMRSLGSWATETYHIFYGGTTV